MPIINVVDELSRIRGVGDVTVVGAGNYSMRLWLDADKLKARNLTTQDVINAVQEQNVQVAAGLIGAPPGPSKQSFQYTILTLGRLSDPSQFADIIVKVEKGPAPRITRVKDVGRVELAPRPTASTSRSTASRRRAWPSSSSRGPMPWTWPPGSAQEWSISKSASPKASSTTSPSTPRSSSGNPSRRSTGPCSKPAGLVLLVILVFLQDWRAVLVPATTVPVTIIGAFAAMFALGFTINLLTLFGLVLAIGIVVDDAIVIVEGASRHIEGGAAPKEAAIRAMSELLGPIIGITLVLSAVFLPASFLAGTTGRLYRQFALTIAATAVISAINAMTLKPAQCAVYLRPPSGRRQFIVWRLFNSVYGRLERAYAAASRWAIRHPALVMIVFAALVGVTVWGYLALPNGFLPVEDQGYFIISLQLPDAASQARTKEVIDQVDQVVRATPGVQNVNAIVGMNVFDQTVSPNFAACYVTLKPWSQRTDPSQSLEGILGRLRGNSAAFRGR